MKSFVLSLLLLCTQALAQVGEGHLESTCGHEGYACGECDTGIQDQFTSLLNEITGGAPNQPGSWEVGGERSIRPGVTLESTLARIKSLMTANGGGLNYMVIGESESLQGTDVRNGKMYPRIAIKSPNSELWVTFSTDPTQAAYQTLEVMRWNGRDAKYDFMELDFNPKHRRMDATGQRCLSCHKAPEPRPNWDTYRAWAGIVPSRDDMLENLSTDGLAADGRAYLSFLDQVVEAKRLNRTPDRPDRLSLLDIPVDDQVQFAGRTPPVSSLSPQAQVAAIREQVRSEGFYRIPHSPYVSGLKNGTATNTASNFDDKTADYAGPSQMAFDQMSGQNMCRVATSLKRNPQWDKIKNYIAGLAMNCSNMQQAIPPSFADDSRSWFNQNLALRLPNTHPIPTTPAGDFSSLQNLVTADTQANHAMADQIKIERHTRFLQRFLGPSGKAEASEFASTFTAPVRDGFHAIGDSGGVKGVAEGDTSRLSMLRLVLEPLGIEMSHWSMMRGPDHDYNSYAFSDQFQLFFDQPIVQEVIREIRSSPEGTSDACDAAKGRSRAALSTAQIRTARATPLDQDLEQLCARRLSGTPIPPPVLRLILAVREREAKSLFKKCSQCHHGPDASPPEFPGLRRVRDEGEWNEQSWSSFQTFLRNPSEQIETMKRYLDEGFMPPMGWGQGASPTEIHDKDHQSRQFLLTYVRLSQAASEETSPTVGEVSELDLNLVCNTVRAVRSSLNYLRENLPSPSTTSGATANP